MCVQGKTSRRTTSWKRRGPRPSSERLCRDAENPVAAVVPQPLDSIPKPAFCCAQVWIYGSTSPAKAAWRILYLSEPSSTPSLPAHADHDDAEGITCLAGT